jgi:hypothetical protein
MLQDKIAYGVWIAKPSFDAIVDSARQPLNIPLPNRRAKAAAFSLYHTVRA